MCSQTNDPLPARPDTRQTRVRQILVSGLGLGAPFLAAIVALPILLRNLGLEQFGLFGLFWTLIGYTSIFEFGLGKGVTRDLSGRTNDAALVGRVVSTSMAFAVGLGAVAMLIIFVAFPIAFPVVLKDSGSFQSDARLASFYLIGAIPFIVMTPIFYGLFEARQDFKMAAACRATIGALIFAAPAIVTLYSPDVPSAIAAIAAVRVLTTVGLGFISLRKARVAVSAQRIDLSTGRALLQYGGWITLTTLVGPIVLYADRFLLTSYYGLTVTSLYLVPFEFLIRFMILPSAISAVVFPRFSAGHLSGHDCLKLLHESSLIVLFTFGIPAAIFAAIALLQAEDLTQFAGTVAMWHTAAYLVVGFMIMSLTYVPQTLLMASGSAALLARFSILELVLWLIYAPYLIEVYSVLGATIAFTLRSVITLTGYAMLVRRTLSLRKG